MRRYVNLFILALVILSLTLIPHLITYNVDASNASISVTPSPFLADDIQPALSTMHFTREQRRAHNNRFINAAYAKIDAAIQRRLAATASFTSINNLNKITYTPTDRDQGSAGTCWVWAGTAAMEADLKTQLNPASNRLSIQYFDSNYNDGTYKSANNPLNWAGCGGDMWDFSEFYDTRKIAVPWSNTGASYQDGSRICSTGTAVPASAITTTPNYTINSSSTTSISTFHDAAAVSNIKTIINQGKVPVFCFYLANSADWSAFKNFWYSQPESALWTGNFSCGKYYDYENDGAGHAVACVGYNDDSLDTNQHYWIMLNSWGTASGMRPNGLFRVPIYYNYNCADSEGLANTYWYKIDTTYTASPSPGKHPFCDFTGNWKSQVSVYRPAAGNWYLYPSQSAIQFGTSTDIPVPGDYNGDGVTDRAFWRPADGCWYVHPSLTPTQFGLDGDIPVPADYNSDGVIERAVWRPSTGNWYIYPSFTPTQFGLNGDIPVPADYDGNGTAERAVYRPSTGNWYIYPSFTPIQFGLNGDMPVPADYNGDGTTERAVWRPGTGNWYVYPSFTPTQYGLNGDLPCTLTPGNYYKFFKH